MTTSPDAARDTPVFCCRDIVKCYEGEPVISGINLDLRAGEIISLVGPSGVGKTTLFNVLAGVDKPDAGQILLNGADITGVAGRVSYMMQKALLLEYRTVLNNVILPLLIRGVPQQAAREQVTPFFTEFGLSGCEDKYPGQLSGGMQQRAALLRSCLQENPVILLDEPFSALDALTRRNMRDWFQNIIRSARPPASGSQRLSAVFITHDVEEAIVLSDRVYTLAGTPGRISAVFEIAAAHPRSRDYPLTPEFAAQKKAILDVVEGSA
ncbi:MAG: ABC transporter ATP-binding protein [Nevskiaceae bacterium]|jgi:ABC-type nitrate/sulfonate/bicarbonate transport system ATPase subunit|nr:ABC transporter ATP-binding protein [Nevskiaceae bacterium]